MPDEPDALQQELESLAQLGHPQAYRELVKFYQVRSFEKGIILRAAQRLWEITDDASDPFLWNVVKEHFSEAHTGEGYTAPGALTGDTHLLRFVEAVWRQAGEDHVETGCDPAESFANLGQQSHAAGILLCLVDRAGANENAVVQCLRQLAKAGRIEEAWELVERFKQSLSKSAGFLARWGEMAVEHGVAESIEELSQPPLISRLGDRDPLLACRLLQKSGRSEEATTFASAALRSVMGRGPSSELREIAGLCDEMGLREEVEKTLREEYPEDVAKDILRDITGRRPGRVQRGRFG